MSRANVSCGDHGYLSNKSHATFFHELGHAILQHAQEHRETVREMHADIFAMRVAKELDFYNDFMSMKMEIGKRRRLLLDVRAGEDISYAPYRYVSRNDLS